MLFVHKTLESENISRQPQQLAGNKIETILKYFKFFRYRKAA